MSDDVRRAWAYLSRVAEPPCARTRERWSARSGPSRPPTGSGEATSTTELARRTEARRDIDCAAEDLEILDRMGGRLVTPADAEWPLLAFTVVRRCRRAPSVRGRIRRWCCGRWGRSGSTDVAERACAIVGTQGLDRLRRARRGRPRRRAGGTRRGGGLRRCLRHRRCGAPGGAGGRRAHRRGARGRRRRAVSRGPHRRCCAASQEQGLLVSEYPPGIRPARHRFLTRNRLVAALSGATVVVEAGLRSGAANTAAWAKALGRPVCAVPGPVTSSASAGCHVLLRRRGPPGHPRRGNRRIGRPDGRTRARDPERPDVTARRAD